MGYPPASSWVCVNTHPKFDFAGVSWFPVLFAGTAFRFFALSGFLHWMLGAGQRQAAALGYLPFSKDVAIKEEAAIARIH
jgi:hypothetical protein